MKSPADPHDPSMPLAGRIAWDIEHTVVSMEQDIDWIVEYWNMWRSRDPLLDALDSAWPEWTGPTLLELTPQQLALVQSFHELRISIRLWALFTEAMPLAMREKLEHAAQRLRVRGDAAIDALGGLPELPARGPKVPAWWGSLQR